MLTTATLDALGVQRAAALLAAELAREHGQSWQRAGARVAAPLAEALLALARLLAAGGVASMERTTAAVLRAIATIRPLAAGETGQALRRAQRVAQDALGADATLASDH